MDIYYGIIEVETSVKMDKRTYIHKFIHADKYVERESKREREREERERERERRDKERKKRRKD